ncbi:MAG: hypothetical protein LKE40_12000 [Spirochaetia bacterium]|nr:hypothetical protein [Spirochaetia bacterium]
MQVAMQEEENRPELLARGKGVPAMVGLKEARGRSVNEVAAWDERQHS